MDELFSSRIGSEEQTELADTCEAKGADFGRVLAGRQGLLDDDTYLRLRETFRALADSTRLKIIHSLLGLELCTCDLAVIIDMSEPAVSQHLRLLRALRLVRTRRVGKNVLYSLDDSHVRALLDVSLEHVRHDFEPQNITSHDIQPDASTSDASTSDPTINNPSRNAPSEPLTRVLRGG